MFPSHDHRGDAITVAAGEALGIENLALTPRDQIVKKAVDLNNQIQESLDMISENPTEALMKPGFFQRLDKECDEVSKLYQEIAAMKENTSGLSSLIIQIRSNINEVKKYADTLRNSLVGKQVPATLFLYGPSGIGKSKCVEQVLDVLSRLEGGRPITSYTRTPEVHWSGYCGQDVVIIDDFNCSAECQDHLELQQMYTTQAFLPRMPEIEMKGKPFTSKYLILCSNFANVVDSKIIRDASRS